MAGNKLRLKIITPIGTKIDEDVDLVVMRCIDGDWGVMAGHDKHSAVLIDYGAIRIFGDEGENRLAAYGGLAEVQDNVLTILTREAFLPEDIDRARAENDLEVARQHLQEQLEDAELHMYGVRLRRSLVMIEVSSYPMVGK